MKQYFTKLRKTANSRMFDAASAITIVGMSGGLKFALIVAVLLLVYFALKKLDEIKKAKEEGTDDEDKTE